jgi:hypothetical protein
VANWAEDFWANVGNNADKLARTHPLVGGAMDGIGNLNKSLGKVSYGGPTEHNKLGTLNFSGSQQPQPQVQKAVNTNRLPGMGGGDLSALIHGSANRDKGQQGTPPLLARGQEPDPMQKLIDRRAQLEAMLDEDYTGDPETDNLINEAYSSALANVAGARTRANDNFAKSDSNIAALSAGHVNTIKTDDLNAVKRIGGELQGGYQKTYDTAHGSLEADRNSELAERTSMLQRLGIQEAGLGDSGQDESEAMSRLNERQAGAMQQAQGYQAADEVRNTEQAQSQASAGVERRSALNKDLQGILGNLDQAETELGTSRAQAQLQSRQSGMKDHNQRLGMISDSINDIDDRIDSRTDSDRDYSLELQKLAQKNSGTGGVFDALNRDFTSRNIDPAPYQQAYSEVAASVPYNSQVDGDKTLWTIRQMKKKNSKLSDSEIARWVNGKDNYGTDKLM